MNKLTNINIDRRQLFQGTATQADNRSAVLISVVLRRNL